MTARRLPTGGEIDRSRPLAFRFDGRELAGFAGDTLASALLGSSVGIVGRSFKYHRPRGIWGAGVEEPNALVDIAGDGAPRPNARATTELLTHGLVARSVNAAPDAARDRSAWLDAVARFIPAAFYYKTFMWPDWHRYEPRIRAMAGLGRIDPDWAPDAIADQRNARCDLLVIGGGPAGLAAALAGAASGRSVMLVDDQIRAGGTLLHRASEIDGLAGPDWVARALTTLAQSGAVVLSDTTAYGLYDHGLVCLAQRHRDHRPDTLWRVRPGRIVLAAGAIERPLVFADNDRPGVMSADAALRYLRRHAVLPGERIVVAANNDSAYEVATTMAAAGATVTLVDARDERPGMVALRQGGVTVIAGRRIARVDGRRAVAGVTLDEFTRIAADAVLVSGGWTPTVHLFCQARGKLAWDDASAAFVPGDPVPGLAVVGAARGIVALSAILADGHRAGGGTAAAPRSTGREATLATLPVWPDPTARGRAWIDFQNDVTVKDVALAARENFVSVEHLKRYTTLGMATDQGKSSGLNGLALMAVITGRAIPEVGTTTYRPPFVPVPFATIAGARRGELMVPVRRLPLEARHRADAAAFREYGGWLRPAFYGAGAPDDEIQREAREARRSVALFDASPLGKIEVIGPDAAAFLDFIYYKIVSTLKPGRIRYGFMLSETGVVYDDGVLSRIADDHFVVSCSSSHVAGVHAQLEEWRQDRFDRRRLVIHNATAAQATLAASGPRARALVERLGLGVDLDDERLPHMAFAAGAFDGTAVRVARVSFTGDRSYEIAIRADRAEPLWQRMVEEGAALGAVRIGVEALAILRAEKGYVMVGKDTDGLTLPHDLGVAGPRDKRTGEYVGRRSLFTAEAQRPDRRQLVGLAVAPGEAPLATGAHAVERAGGVLRSIGYVTSSYASPTLARPIALGLVERGAARHGETVEIQHLGAVRRATLVKPCALDPEGVRLNA